MPVEHSGASVVTSLCMEQVQAAWSLDIRQTPFLSGLNLLTIPFTISWPGSARALGCSIYGLCTYLVYTQPCACLPGSSAGSWCLPVVPSLEQVKHCGPFSMGSV